MGVEVGPAVDPVGFVMPELPPDVVSAEDPVGLVTPEFVGAVVTVDPELTAELVVGSGVATPALATPPEFNDPLELCTVSFGIATVVTV